MFESLSAPADFARWTINTARQFIGHGIDPALTEITRAFFQGDHWQNATAWIGPTPDPNDPGSYAIMGEVFKGFTSKNVIKEVDERHRDGVMGQEPAWQWTPIEEIEEGKDIPAELQTLIREAGSALTTWWDEKHVHEILKDALTKLLYTCGRDGGKASVALRIYVPRGLLVPLQVRNADGSVSATMGLRVTNLQEALAAIYVDSPEPEKASVFQHPETMMEIGLFATTVNNRDQVEMTYLDPLSGQTVLAIANANGTSVSKLDLGRRLLMHSLRRETFITEQARQSQRALNLSNSMIPRNSITAGFLETIILNGLMPGHYEIVDKGTEKERKVYVPDPFYRGPNTQNWIRGIVTEGPQGQQSLSTPQVHERQPIAPTTTIEAKREHYRDILEETKQVHILISGDAVASGISREEARADHEKALATTAIAATRAGRWLLETVLAFAEVLANQPGHYTGRLRASFTCNIDTGPLTAEDLTADAARVTAGTLSRATSMERARIADPDAEISRINQEDGGNIRVSLQQSQTFASWVASGLPMDVAAELTGLTPEQVKLIADAMADAEAEAEDDATDPTAPADPADPTAPADDAPADPADPGVPARAEA